jgi:small ligand-binding sensory domain FIST
MQGFRCAHATHRQWRSAVDLVVKRLDAQGPPASNDAPAVARLGIVYVTHALSGRLGEIRDLLAERLPGHQWVGASTHGVCATGVEYQEAPALVVMLCSFPQEQLRVFSERADLATVQTGARAIEAALVHADPATPDLSATLIQLSRSMREGRLFGGVIGGESGPSLQLAGGIVAGGVSGVAFTAPTMLRSRVTQACSPLAGEHVISACTSNYIRTLDGRPALDVLLDDLGVPAETRESRDGDEILRALPAARLSRGLMVGLAPADAPRGFGFGDYLVRNVVGIDPTNRLLAVAARPQAGERAVFCTRDQRAARADLIRICTELREDVENDSLQVLGAHYVSCVARGAHLFGAPGAELELIAHNLGEVPLVGFFANGEIAGERLYGYTGVLTLFVAPGRT